MQTTPSVSCHQRPGAATRTAGIAAISLIGAPKCRADTRVATTENSTYPVDQVRSSGEVHVAAEMDQTELARERS
jgi:hypothetical protein